MEKNMAETQGDNNLSEENIENTLLDNIDNEPDFVSSEDAENDFAHLEDDFGILDDDATYQVESEQTTDFSELEESTEFSFEDGE